MNDRIWATIFGVSEGYELAGSEHSGDFLRLHLNVRTDHFVCPHCQSREVSRKGHRYRELQTVPVGLTPVFLHTEVPDCQCRACGSRFELAPPLPPPIAGSPIAWWNSCKPSRK